MYKVIKLILTLSEHNHYLVTIQDSLSGKYDPTFASLSRVGGKKSAQGREFKVYNEREGRKVGKDKKERKRGNKEEKKGKKIYKKGGKGSKKTSVSNTKGKRIQLKTLGRGGGVIKL